MRRLSRAHGPQSAPPARLQGAVLPRIIDEAPRISDYLCPECEAHSMRFRRNSMSLASPNAEPPSGARTGLLHSYGIRDRATPGGRPERHRGRRQIRRTHRADRRQADARRGLRHGHRTHNPEPERAGPGGSPARSVSGLSCACRRRRETRGGQSPARHSGDISVVASPGARASRPNAAGQQPGLVQHHHPRRR